MPPYVAIVTIVSVLHGEIKKYLTVYGRVTSKKILTQAIAGNKAIYLRDKI